MTYLRKSSKTFKKVLDFAIFFLEQFHIVEILCDLMNDVLSELRGAHIDLKKGTAVCRLTTLLSVMEF